MEKTSEDLYRERTRRVEDAIQLVVPDRVPIVVKFGLFPAKYVGNTFEECFYDYQKWRGACRKTILAFEPDMYSVSHIVPGTVLESLDCQQIKWPGHGIAPNHPFQFVEREYMKADEYDAFIDDPSDFAVRTYMPRIYGALDSFQTLPSLSSMLFGYPESLSTRVLSTPELAKAFESLSIAGREALRWHTGMSSFDDEIKGLGFPLSEKAITHAPFDLISDYFRGMRGAMLDMYRQPDKLLASCEKLLPMMIKRGISVAEESGNPRIFIPLHRGADGFMSSKQFETFYWPTLKRLIIAFVDKGLTPCPFFEGDYTSRLEYLLELPRGKVLGYFDTTDLFKVKEVLGNHMCIQGNVPSSLLQTGTPQDVKDYCKKLIDVVGKDGGFIMSPRSSIDEAKPENLMAMFDFTKQYGVYR